MAVPENARDHQSAVVLLIACVIMLAASVIAIVRSGFSMSLATVVALSLGLLLAVVVNNRRGD